MGGAADAPTVPASDAAQPLPMAPLATAGALPSPEGGSYLLRGFRYKSVSAATGLAGFDSLAFLKKPSSLPAFLGACFCTRAAIWPSSSSIVLPGGGGGADSVASAFDSAAFPGASAGAAPAPRLGAAAATDAVDACPNAPNAAGAGAPSLPSALVVVGEAILAPIPAKALVLLLLLPYAPKAGGAACASPFLDNAGEATEPNAAGEAVVVLAWESS